jgi:hypothetical protein
MLVASKVNPELAAGDPKTSTVGGPISELAGPLEVHTTSGADVPDVLRALPLSRAADVDSLGVSAAAVRRMADDGNDSPAEVMGGSVDVPNTSVVPEVVQLLVTVSVTGRVVGGAAVGMAVDVVGQAPNGVYIESISKNFLSGSPQKRAP